MTEAEYKAEWLTGLHHTEYNNCRFAEDKVKFGIDWIKEKLPTVNLENPQNIIDRINWCKLYDLDIRKPIWADKISVNYQLHELGLDDIIISPIYFTRSYLTKYEFDRLPNGKYIFKCNHGSGWNIRFEKKQDNDPTYLLNKLKEWYNLNYAYMCGWEWQYDKIIPGIIIQPDYGQLKDWSFWCENGEIVYVQTSRKLGKNLEEFFTFTDKEGKQPDGFIGLKPMRFYLLNSELSILEKMKPIVYKLASNFKFVRVDLYSINNNIKFSELTFSPCSGKLIWKKLD